MRLNGIVTHFRGFQPQKRESGDSTSQYTVNHAYRLYHALHGSSGGAAHPPTSSAPWK